MEYFQVDSIQKSNIIKLKTDFPDRISAENYITKIPSLLQESGFVAASVDSAILQEQGAKLWIYYGERIVRTVFTIDAADQNWLDAIRWDVRRTSTQPFSWAEWKKREASLLDYLENNGYPFAKVRLDSIKLTQVELWCKLNIERGPLYKIDSIRNHGTAKISAGFLQQYLGIKNGSIYRKDQLFKISARINELSYLKEHRPWTMIRLGTGAILDMDLESRKSNQINVLLGFLPATTNSANPYEVPRTKMQFTGEAQVNLKNALSYGESISLNWQQLQQQAPRLDLRYRQPYVRGTAWGTDLQFNLFKKDSSFVTVSMQAGTAYAWNNRSSGAVFVQSFRSSLISVDTNLIRQTKKLPAEADVSTLSVGLTWEGNNTDFKYNPTSGNEWLGMVQAGSKKVMRQQAILNLKDPQNSGFIFSSLYDSLAATDYQIKIETQWAHYFRVSKNTTLRAAFQGAWLESKYIFRNDLYQIGGYKLLRGFDEQSIYASRYAVLSMEYRYLIGRNSFLFAFVDGASVYSPKPVPINHQYAGMGLGMALETKAGIFNMSLAAGKRNDLALDLRQSKIHLGYLSFF